MGDNVNGHNMNISLNFSQIVLGTPELWPCIIL